MDNTIINLGTMPPALLITYGATLDKYFYLKPVIEEAKK
jgi:hypothetical protein